jgi:prepilin-type N-terminal cleavage/methylation domain-containing protein
MKKDHQNTTLSKKNKGFSLIEVLIAMAIFSIGILAVGSMQLASTKNNTTGNITTQASMLARQKIEELRAVQEDLKDIVLPDNDKVDSYDRNWGLVIPGDDCDDDFCQVFVEVGYDRWPADRKVRLETILRGK